jgi:hypothetical protein
MKRAIRFLFRWAYRLTGTAVITMALLVAFAQTDVFRSWLRDFLIDTLNNALVGTVTFEDVHIDLLHGVSIDQPRLYADSTLVLSARRIAVNYDVAPFITGQTVVINALEIDSANVFVLRSAADSVWNVSRIVKPAADTTPAAPPKFTFIVRRLALTRSQIVVNDRTVPWGDGTVFDPTHLHLHDVELIAGARFNVDRHEVDLGIDHFRFTDQASPLAVRDLSCAVRLSRGGVDLRSLNVRMPRTTIAVRATLNKVDLFEGFTDEQLQQNPLIGDIVAEPINGADLRYFLPEIDILGSFNVRANARFGGSFVDVRDLDLKSADARVPSLLVQGRVRVDNLSGDKPLYLDVHVHDSHGSYADVRRGLRFVPLPELTFLKKATLRDVRMTGSPSDSLHFLVSASDAPGEIDGELTLILDRKELGYELDAKIGRGDLSVFNDGDTSTRTNVNGRVMLVGYGTSLQTIAATAQIELQSSSILGRPIRAARFMANADGHGTIVVDTLFVNASRDVPDTVDPYSEFAATRRIGLSGRFGFADLEHPTYDVHLDVTGLDLRELVRSPGMPTRFSASFDVRGEGFHLDSLNTDLEGRISEFALEDRSILGSAIRASVRRGPNENSIVVRTRAMDADIRGRFMPTQLIDAIVASVEVSTDLIATRLGHIIKKDLTEQRVETTVHPLTARFDIAVKDPSPVNIFLDGLELQMDGRVAGMIETGQGSLMMSIDTLVAMDTRIMSDSMTIESDPFTGSLLLRCSNLNAEYPVIDEFTTSVQVDSLFTLNDLTLTHPSITAGIRDRVVTVKARSGINDMQASVNMQAALGDHHAVIRMDSMSFMLDSARRMSWTMQKTGRLQVENGVATIDTFIVRRLDRETMSVRGVVSTESFQNAEVEIRNFVLSDLEILTGLGVKHPASLVDGVVKSLVVRVDGSYAEPVIGLKGMIERVRYNDELIGEMDIDLSHVQKRVNGYMRITNMTVTDAQPTVDLNIEAIPIDLAFTSVQSRLVDGEPWDVRLTANKLGLGAVQPFLPAIEQVRGTADATVHITGSLPDDINFDGSGSFRKATFVATSTNIPYWALGSMRLKGSDLIFDTLEVHNFQQDLPGGVANATGYVRFDGLSVASMDFSLRTPGIVVMNKSSAARSPELFGDVRIASGDQAIRLYGPLDAPKLTGDIVLLYGDVMFPEERSTTKKRLTTYDYVSLGGDSLRSAYDDLIGRLQQSEAPVDTFAVTSPTVTQTEVVTEAVRRAIETNAAGFADILEYDLRIWLKGRFLLTMVLGVAEIIIADLEPFDIKKPLTFTGSFAKGTHMTGVVRLREGTSTYKFYKPFSASGVLNFDTGDMTNPKLDLRAVYAGYRYINEKREDYRVVMDITGTKQVPDIKFRLFRNDREIVSADTNKIKGDAIMLILVNMTQDELTTNGQGDLVSQVNSAMSAVATSALGDLFSGHGGVVQNVQLDVGAELSDSRLHVTGQLFSNVSYRFSGNVTDMMNNSTITVTIPLSVLGQQDALRYFNIDLSASTSQTGNITRYQKSWEAKFGARIP